MNNQHQQESAEYSRAWMDGAEAMQQKSYGQIEQERIVAEVATWPPAKQRFYEIILWSEFGYSSIMDEPPALEGAAGDVREGEAARLDYQERFDLFWGEMAKVAEKHLSEGGQSYEEVLRPLEKMLALHNKIISVPVAGWWAGMAVDLSGHPKDDFKKLVWGLRFYAQSA